MNELNAAGRCPHNYDPRGCYVCKAERVLAGLAAKYSTGPTLWITPAEAKHLGIIPHKRGGARAVAIVALRRIVDRAVSDEVNSLATADILRIALKTLNQLED